RGSEIIEEASREKSSVRAWSLVAECARARAQQLPTERGPRYFPAGSKFLHCCARGRAHSEPGLPPLTDGIQSPLTFRCLTTTLRHMIPAERRLPPHCASQSTRTAIRSTDSTRQAEAEHTL